MIAMADQLQVLGTVAAVGFAAVTAAGFVLLLYALYGRYVDLRHRRRLMRWWEAERFLARRQREQERAAVAALAPSREGRAA